MDEWTAGYGIPYTFSWNACNTCVNMHLIAALFVCVFLLGILTPYRKLLLELLQLEKGRKKLSCPHLALQLDPIQNVKTYVVSWLVHPINACSGRASCLHVCIEVALRGDAHGIGRSNWAKGRDPSGSWVQYPNLAVPTAQRHSRWVVLTHSCALSEPTLL